MNADSHYCSRWLEIDWKCSGSGLAPILVVIPLNHSNALARKTL